MCALPYPLFLAMPSSGKLVLAQGMGIEKWKKTLKFYQIDPRRRFSALFSGPTFLPKFNWHRLVKRGAPLTARERNKSVSDSNTRSFWQTSCCSAFSSFSSQRGKTSKIWRKMDWIESRVSASEKQSFSDNCPNYCTFSISINTQFFWLH